MNLAKKIKPEVYSKKLLNMITEEMGDEIVQSFVILCQCHKDNMIDHDDVYILQTLLF